MSALGIPIVSLEQNGNKSNGRKSQMN